MKKIIIIEDDLGIVNSLKLYLENSNFSVETHNSGRNAVEIIKKISPDLIILDINLPELSGIEICKKIRTFSQIPIIMLTARTSEMDKIIGLEIGADDYIPKPFSPRELLARINSTLRRIGEIDKKNNSDIIKFRNIEIDTKEITIKINNKKIPITKNEFDIFKKLVEENGKLVTRETIMTEVIGYEKYIFDRTIDTHIKNLRKKLGDKDIIITVRGEGYRLNK
ncbi:DNA-binding response regulator [Candidatus Gracilibacteria bacterium]|nr:MAG: DNA-binding response regulator [Candidatus Gracilibacteria bacterium]PIE85192.1 MAG: DNA-binding response regulator [Candidatus Gracilibacteria bacterium]